MRAYRDLRQASSQRGGTSSGSLRKQLKGAAYLPILRMHERNCASFAASLHNLTMAWFIYMGVKMFVLSRLWYLTGEWEKIETTSRQFEILISAPPWYLDLQWDKLTSTQLSTILRDINIFSFEICHSKMHLMFCGGHTKESKNLCKNIALFFV